MDAVEDLSPALKKIKFKSASVAGALGFLLPWAGALYVRKYWGAVALLIVDIVLGAFRGVPGVRLLLFIYHTGTAYLVYRWSEQVNQQARAQLEEFRNS
jgi:ABC-type arginine transport system permease subunit